MNETEVNENVGKSVTYGGNSRPHLRNKVGHVASVKTNGFGQATSFGVDIPGEPKLVWAAPWSWDFVVTDEDIDQAFSEALGGPLAQAEAEIIRLKARLAELENAVKVIKSL